METKSSFMLLLARRYIRGKDDECWPWKKPSRATGYGLFTVQGHRLLWELERGPIPAGMHIDHLCRNRACVNPAHLEPVTQAENTRRGISRAAVNWRKTHCFNGHPFDDGNTIKDVSGRRCRICNNAWQNERYRTKVKPFRPVAPPATHCRRGHPFAGANLIVRENGTRLCRECTRMKARESYHRRKEAKPQ